MQTVLITGGTSGLGRGIVEALLARSVPVTVLARDASRLDEMRRLGARVHQGDATDRATMARAVAESKRLPKNVGSRCGFKRCSRRN